MALDEPNRAVLETILGPIPGGEGFGEEADVEARLARLGHPELAGLEVLLADQSRMARLATKVSSDDVRHDHTENLKAIGSQIEQLVAAIRANDDIGGSLNDAAEALVSRAEVAESSATTVITVEASAARRG